MNRKLTPFLLGIALVLGLIAYLAERPTASHAARPQSARILAIDARDILRIRVKRDYWNSYLLRRNPDASWQLLEPSNEAASAAAVEPLLAAIGEMPLRRKIDLPADDTERHREYGLWSPTLELTVTTNTGEQTLIFGGNTPDNEGTYCTAPRRDGVFVTSAGIVPTLAIDPSSLRVSGKTSP